MAKATRDKDVLIYKQVIEQHPVTRQVMTLESVVVIKEERIPGNITLELTPIEAETLRMLCMVIGGHSNGRRGHMDAINQALGSAGVRYEHHSQSNRHYLGNKSIAFVDFILPLQRPIAGA